MPAYKEAIVGGEYSFVEHLEWCFKQRWTLAQNDHFTFFWKAREITYAIRKGKSYQLGGERGSISQESSTELETACHLQNPATRDPGVDAQAWLSSLGRLV
jgi:hypothetical protein